jgi:hypothetical protein
MTSGSFLSSYFTIHGKGKFTKDMKKEGNTTCRQDINKTCQMVARYPFQGNVFWLIEENYFAKDALSFANSLVEQMKQQLQRTKDNNEMRKKGRLCKRTA